MHIHYFRGIHTERYQVEQLAQGSGPFTNLCWRSIPLTLGGHS